MKGNILGDFSPKYKKRNQGFTLIELMIAISILTMLLFTGSYSYSLLSTRWSKELGNFAESVTKAKNQQLVQNLLAGVQTFVITDEKNSPSFFFIGHENSLLAVSREGILSGEYPEIFRLTAIKNENDLFDLIYQSTSVHNLVLLKTDQEIEFTEQLTLFTGLTSVSFSYFGWAHYDEKLKEAVLPATWFDNFSGIDNKLMPTKMRLTLTNDKGSYTIPIALDAKSELRLSPYFEDN